MLFRSPPSTMESSELYHVKQQFILGAYKALAELSPEIPEPDYTSLLLYKVRSLIALGDPKAALALIPPSEENVALKSAASLARYVAATDDTAKEAALEELRDLSVEVESDDAMGSPRDKALVRVVAGTAFARAGEVEEALETLGTETEDLEAVAVIVQIYLSINRPDLAKKQFDRSKKWAEDDLLLQLIESNIGLVSGKDGFSNSQSFYSEQLANPSMTSPHLLTARGVTRLLRNEIQEAKSDLEEALLQQSDDAETLAALVVAGGLGALKKEETEAHWSRLASEHPSHPLVQDVNEKSQLFDELVGKFPVPQPVAV